MVHSVWADRLPRTKRNFLSYTTERKIKSKELDKLKVYLPHLKKAQGVQRTWNFSHAVICGALLKINEELGLRDLKRVFLI